MAFIVALHCEPQRFYFMQQDDGTVLLTTNRAKATPFPEERADMLAAAHNLYTIAEEAIVEGFSAKDAPPEAVAS